MPRAFSRRQEGGSRSVTTFLADAAYVASIAEVRGHEIRRWSTAGVMVALVTVSGLLACGPHAVFKADYERFRSIKEGMTEAEVRDRLGKPAHEYDRATAPKDYYVKGYSFNAT